MEVDPSNVEGAKVDKTVRTHSVNWEVNVSHVLLFAGVAYGLYKFGPLLVGSSSEDQEDRDGLDPGGAEIEVAGDGGLIE